MIKEGWEQLRRVEFCLQFPGPTSLREEIQGRSLEDLDNPGQVGLGSPCQQ